MKIVIPSYKRFNDFKTLTLLEGYEDITYIFVVEEELQFYKERHSKWNFVVGEKGLKQQRNFITNYFDEGEILVCLDDDIRWLNKPLKDWLQDAVDYLSKSSLGMITFPPNTMYMKDYGYKEGHYFGIGAFYILKNHKELQLQYTQGEDFERSLYYLKRYGKTIRIPVYFRTTYFGKGGLESYRTIETYVHETNKLVYEYKNDLYFKDKKIMKHDLSNVHLFRKREEKKVVQLGYYNCFDKLYEMFEAVTLQKRIKHTNRLGFPDYRGAIFGMVRPRFKYKGYDELSLDSRNNPRIYEELLRLGKIICPFPLKSIQVNKNLVCPPHLDGNNRGLSLLVSFGDYTGCNLVVDGKTYDTKYRPILFDGALLKHYNTDDLQGTKYSLVFFS